MLVDRERGRILVTRRPEDLEQGWDVAFQSEDWEEAMDYAMEFAEDYIVEWYYEDEVRNARARAGHLVAT